MKVFVMVNNYGAGNNEGNSRVQGPLGWYLLADSAVTNTGKPFYLPENYGKVVVSVSIAVRISRLGKFISRKFAPRYYTEYAPVLHFRMPEYERKLKGEGLPGDAARNFDKSLFAGDLLPLGEEQPVELYVNGEKSAEFSRAFLNNSLERVVEEVSQMNTLKMGDLILPALSGEIELHRGDFLELKQTGKGLFSVRVK